MPGNRIYLISILAAVVLVTGVYWYQQKTTDFLTVDGVSMVPTIRPGEKVQINADLSQPLQAGELVALQFKMQSTRMLKRVIAVAGDEVQFIDGRLKVNGSFLSTTWWPENKRLEDRHYRLLALQLSRYQDRVPRDSLIVMGDNSTKSFDSGDYGLISLQQVVGRVVR